ncbi:MAG: radical SAM protein [Clostridia bacterium]|nr:radical SAM protein [Clostridia bacterium]
MHFVDARSILSPQNGINPYRGCTHGCIYCDSRSDCYRMNHAFEDVEVKQNAPQLLEEALSRKRKRCMIATGAMCDPYMHCEEQLQLTRQCLEIIGHYGFGAAVQTKSCRILRDLDLLGRINEKSRAVVQMTLTTADEDLCRILEPHVSTTVRRYEALKEFQERGIPTAVWISPLLPFLNDTEDNLRRILEYCFDAGVRAILCFGIGVTLRAGDREYFYAALDRHFPGLRRRYESAYGDAYEVLSPNHPSLMRLFHRECERHGVLHDAQSVFAWMREFPEDSGQLRLI